MKLVPKNEIDPKTATVEEWAKFWNIEPGTAECSNCGTTKHMNIPFAEEDLRGFEAPPCECGHPANSFRYIVLDSDAEKTALDLFITLLSV